MSRGRPKKADDEKLVQASVALTSSEWDYLSRLADEHRVSRASLVRLALRLGIGQLADVPGTDN